MTINFSSSNQESNALLFLDSEICNSVLILLNKSTCYKWEAEKGRIFCSFHNMNHKIFLTSMEIK